MFCFSLDKNISMFLERLRTAMGAFLSDLNERERTRDWMKGDLSMSQEKGFFLKAMN